MTDVTELLAGWRKLADSVDGWAYSDSMEDEAFSRDARQPFARLLDAVQAGEEVLITRRGRPVARLKAEYPAAPDFSVFRRLRGAWKEGMRIARDELHERT